MYPAQEAKQQYGSNYVTTSHYTWWNFLPKNLFEQFQNLANLYFACVAVLQLIPKVSTTSESPTMLMPLGFVILVSAFRAILEDLAKHKLDNKRNGALYNVLQPDATLAQIKSGQIKVGNVVKVEQNQMIPADMIFLSSSFDKGHCFIDKSNLNGETTLEVMSSLMQTRSCKDSAELANLEFQLEFEPPNNRFDTFRGTMQLGGASSESIPIDGKMLMMRETILRNCPFVWGLVVYAGSDTKIQMSNSDGPKSSLIKVSRIMKQTGTYLKGMLILQFLMCFLAAIFAGQPLLISCVLVHVPWTDRLCWRVCCFAPKSYL